MSIWNFTCKASELLLIHVTPSKVASKALLLVSPFPSTFITTPSLLSHLNTSRSRGKHHDRLSAQPKAHQVRDLGIVTSLDSCADNSRRDLAQTFEILVGTKRFTLHESVLTPRSHVLASSRRLAAIASVKYVLRPVDLRDEDPDVFQTHMYCVYFGKEVLREHLEDFKLEIESFGTRLFVSSVRQDVTTGSLRHALERIGDVDFVQILDDDRACIDFALRRTCTEANCDEDLKSRQIFLGSEICFETALENAGLDANTLAQARYQELIRLYLLAEKLVDPCTAKMTIDSMISLLALSKTAPDHSSIGLVYASTNTKSNCLRLFVRDAWVFHLSRNGEYLNAKNDHPRDFVQEVMAELIRSKTKGPANKIRRVFPRTRSNQYHQHSNWHRMEECTR